MPKEEKAKKAKPKKKKVVKKPAFTYRSSSIPKDAGCYLYYDEKGVLLYVGKAKNLRKRVSNYFQKTKHSVKTATMVSKVRKIETRVVSSEMEALVLENNLIKEFRPRFNILLRDDKNFLYLRLTNDAIPKIEITRRIVRDGSFYLGPKTSAKSFRKTIAFCQKIFQVRDCRLKFEVSDSGPLKVVSNPENRKLPCMDFHIKKCSGPCTEEISVEDYAKDVEAMKRFLRGHTDEVMKDLQVKMMSFAENQNFEAAAKLRDLMGSIEVSTEKQNVQFGDTLDRDFVHFYRQKKSVWFVRLAFRNGKLLDQNEVEFRAEDFMEDVQVLEQFLIQFYEKVDQVPSEIYLPHELEKPEVLEEMLLSQLSEGSRRSSVKLLMPQKGDKLKLLKLALINAKNVAKKHEIEVLSQADNFSKALPNLAEILQLPEPPKRIECYDISHFSGDSTVASQVVFVDGKPKKSEYRRYKIKSLPDKKVDDFASMYEVITRRFTHDEGDKKFAEALPDLIVIDGGKGQLSSVMKVFKDLNPEEVPSLEGFDPETQVISLAKREEQVFRPGNSEPIEMDFTEPALMLLQRCRDEAHRFAITFNRALRSKKQTKSALDEVSGIGPAAKKKLMQTFDTVSGVRNASDEALLKVINKKQLTNLRKFL